MMIMHGDDGDDGDDDDDDDDDDGDDVITPQSYPIQQNLTAQHDMDGISEESRVPVTWMAWLHSVMDLLSGC